MRIKFYVLISGAALIFGCSNPQKKQISTASPTPTATQQVGVTIQLSQPVNSVKSDVKKDETTCDRDGQSRTLRVESLQPKGCKLWYSNFGSHVPVASSQIGITHCAQVRDRIREKLISAGFKCTTDQAQTSTSVAAPQGTPAANPVVNGKAASEKSKN
ncbi:MAG: hypothetical protein IPJ71_11300 [Bdellovibrionales bacterium]|nr:hypothetical protein [Bdellovibrionales bacterium]